MNEKMERMAGECAENTYCYQVLFGLDATCPWCPDETALQDAHATADLFEPRNGRWYRTIHSPLDSSDSSSRFVICLDITNEKAAHLDQDLFSSLLSHANDAIFLIDAETSRVMYANDTACRSLGYTLAEMKRMRVVDFGMNVPGMDEWHKLQSQLDKEGSRYFETFQRRRDGSTLPVEINVRRVNYGGRKYSVSVVRDISERIQAKTALVEEKSKLEAVIAGLTDGVMMVDLDLHIVFQNQVHQQKQGNHVGELCHQAFHDRETPCPGCQVMLGYGDGQTHRRETTAEVDGRKMFLESTATPVFNADGQVIGALEVVRDATEQKRIEVELAKAQKLESLALLAGGIAHDFNNLLAAMLGNISLALHKATDTELRHILQETEKANLRCRQLTQQLLTFSKHGSLQCRSASAMELVREASDFILRGTSIASSCSFPEDLWPVRVDEGQISQVFTNILVNAREALAEHGKISINATNIRTEGSPLLPLAPGRYVKVTIHNDGEAIPDHILPRIFDPYFTTKKKGSGLGLATAYSIVRKHGGEITIDSKKDSGTSFNIFLPASDEPPAANVAAAPAVCPDFSGRRALVMDDEPSVLLMMKGMLEYLGITSVGCNDGEEAEAAYARAMAGGQPFDLAILDLTIKGGTGGEETLHKLKALNPEVVAVVSSGYTEGEFEALEGWSGKLNKPFSLEELSQVLADALGARGASPQQ
jgi:PAS domain S-box-containing protein